MSIKLKDLLHKIDWVMIEKSRFGQNNNNNGVYIGFYASKKDSNDINKVKIKLGRELMERLEWEIGDRICIYHHPDDLMSFMLVKSENSNGFKLGLETNTTFSKLSFKWDRPLKLERQPYKEVEYLSPKDKYIVFRA